MQPLQGQPAHDNKKNPVLAAIDLGSNSFHLIITRIEHHELKPIVQLGEKVQLARDLHDGRLSDDAIARGLACLRRFKQAIDAEQPDVLRIVGTNSLRAAKNARVFTRQARAIFNQPIEIIAGLEEARLVYLGVAHTLADDEHARLVIDIGGGSTEFIVGQRFEPVRMESLYMGCVAFSRRFFDGGGKLSQKRFDQAYKAASAELRPHRAAFARRHWEDCIGSSGTFKAISTIVAANGWGDDGIDREALIKLKTKLLTFDRSDDLAIDGLKDNRKNSITAGTAIALAAFDALKIKRLRHSPGALREGVIYDLTGRLSHEDVRERSIAALVSRYSVNLEKSSRIEHISLQIFNGLKKKWGLSNDARQQLGWAIQLHEIGLSIAHAQFHRHGEYIIRNADLPGFSTLDQHIIAALIRCHRRKIPTDIVDEMNADGYASFASLVAIMRLAMVFKYLGAEDSLPAISGGKSGRKVNVQLSPPWLEANPMMAAELVGEQKALKTIGINLLIEASEDETCEQAVDA